MIVTTKQSTLCLIHLHVCLIYCCNGTVPYFQYILTLTVIAFLHPFLVRWSNNYMIDYIIYNFRKKNTHFYKRKSWIFFGKYCGMSCNNMKCMIHIYRISYWYFAHKSFLGDGILHLKRMVKISGDDNIEQAGKVKVARSLSTNVSGEYCYFSSSVCGLGYDTIEGDHYYQRFISNAHLK